MFNCAPPNFNMVQPKVSEALEEDIEKQVPNKKAAKRDKINVCVLLPFCYIVSFLLKFFMPSAYIID